LYNERAEIETRLQSDDEICTAIRSYEKHKASKKKKRKDLAVLAKTRELNRFFQQKFSSSNVKSVALTRAPTNEGENQDIGLETFSHSARLATLTCSLSGVRL